MSHTTLLTLISEAQSTLSNSEEGDSSTRAALDQLAAGLSESRGECHSGVFRFVCEIESFARQVAQHGEPDLGGVTVSRLLQLAHQRVEEHDEGTVTTDDLENEAQDIRRVILEERPDTNVIEELSLQEEYSACIRTLIREERSTNA